MEGMLGQKVASSHGRGDGKVHDRINGDDIGETYALAVAGVDVMVWNRIQQLSQTSYVVDLRLSSAILLFVRIQHAMLGSDTSPNGGARWFRAVDLLCSMVVSIPSTCRSVEYGIDTPQVHLPCSELFQSPTIHNFA